MKCLRAFELSSWRGYPESFFVPASPNLLAKNRWLKSGGHQSLGLSAFQKTSFPTNNSCPLVGAQVTTPSRAFPAVLCGGMTPAPFNFMSENASGTEGAKLGRKILESILRCLPQVQQNASPIESGTLVSG